MKTGIAVISLLLPLAIGAQVQPKPLADAIRVIKDGVRPQQPGLVSFRVAGAEVPPNISANLVLTLKKGEPAAIGQTANYYCQAVESLFYCPIQSLYGRPSGVFEITSITLTSNTTSGQSNRTFRSGLDFHSAEISVENPKASQPPNLDGLKITDVDVDIGR